LLLIAGGRTLDSTAPSPETSETEANKAACHFGKLDHVIFGFVTSSTQAPSTIRATAGPQAISGHGGNARNMSPNHFLVVMQTVLAKDRRSTAAPLLGLSAELAWKGLKKGMLRRVLSINDLQVKVAWLRWVRSTVESVEKAACGQ
ncbi:hypothetical protein HPB47_001507, partial [Ixodes persulcatus]